MGNIGKIYSRKRFIGWLNTGNKEKYSISNEKGENKIGNSGNIGKNNIKYGKNKVLHH